MGVGTDPSKIVLHQSKGNIMKQQGFTLIELIMVIVILGILAATALPKFAGLTADARLAKMSGLLGSLKAGAAMAHGSSLARSLQAASDITLGDGTSVSMVRYYPAATTGITLVADTADYTTSAVTSGVAFYPDATHKTAGTCTFTYYEAAAATGVSAVPYYDTVGISNVAGCV